MEVISLNNKAAWRRALSAAGRHDFYHTPDYTQNVLKDDEVGYLLCSGRAEPRLLLPLILRPVDLEGMGRSGLHDVTSVYGYAGPVSGSQPPSPCDHARFHADLLNFFTEKKVVTVFSRLHPVLDNHRLLRGLGEIHHVGRTVSVDLSLPPDLQRALYRDNHKTGINKLKRVGVECKEIAYDDFIDEFIEIYHDTMHRVGAEPNYFFNRRYFDCLFKTADYEARLFGCFLQGKMICAGVFTVSRGIVQYHLGGTRWEFMKMAPTKLLFDTVRLWATACGAQVFHLGGGLGGREDSLFHFKAGFSKRFHVFRVWKWVVDRPSYTSLCDARGVASDGRGFFPAYRNLGRPAVSLV